MFRKKLTVAGRLAFGFGVLLLLMILVVLIGITRLQAVDKVAETLIDKDRVIADAISNVDTLMRANGLATLELVINNEPARAVQIRSLIALNKDKITTALSIVGNLDEAMANKALLATVTNERAKYVASFTQVEKMVEQGNAAGATLELTMHTIPILAALQAPITALSEQQTQTTIARGTEVKRIIKAAYFMLAVISSIAISIAVLIALSISRNLTRQLGAEPEYVACIARAVASGDLTMSVQTKESDKNSLLFSMKEMCYRLSCNIGRVQVGTDTIATASSQIAAGNLDLSSRTEQQASALQETASSMEELSSTVKQNAAHAKQANTLAISASDVAIRGGAVVAQVVDTMGSINDSAKKIVDIIDVIDGIAFQTNILALNAAVEAARAGEQGRGFAVVASEVRNLAQRSASAAKEIKSLIDDSVEKVETGSRLVDQAGATMEEIVASVRRVTDIMGEITTASLEQESGIQQINQAINEMDSVTQQNAALVEQAAGAAAALQDQAAALMEVVHVFKLDQAFVKRGLESNPDPFLLLSREESNPAAQVAILGKH